jgi:hypothetical protein
MKKYFIGVIIALVSILVLALPVYAYISEPDSDPTVDEVNIYRNILETGDMLIFAKVNTPYVDPPDEPYAKAFVWQLYDPTDTYEIAQTTGYDHHDSGYNENVIGFYFDSDEAPTWGLQYYMKLTGTPVGFDDPPVYQFPLETGDYSDLTVQNEVQAEISNQVIEWAKDLNSEWGLTGSDVLTYEAETSTVLSLEGQTFFRGAIYGIQSLAPFAFDIQTLNITNEPRTWDTEYSDNMTTAYAGTYIGDAQDEMNDMLGTDYNLFGMLGLLGIMGLLIGASIYVGGDVWGSLVIASGILVIGGRLSMIGMGELALVAALMWLFISGKVWKVF